MNNALRWTLVISLGATASFAASPLVPLRDNGFRDSRTWSHPAEQRNAAIRGSVVDAAGNPIAGATVIIERVVDGSRFARMTLIGGLTGDGNLGVNQRAWSLGELFRQAVKGEARPRNGFALETNADGYFSYIGLNSRSSYQIFVAKEGYLPFERGGAVLTPAMNDLGAITLMTGDFWIAWEAFDAGYEAYSAGNYALAATKMDGVVTIFGEVENSLLITALGVLGSSRLVLGQPEEAEPALVRLVEILPASDVGHSGLGNIRFIQGDFQAAIEHFEIAAQSDPDDPSNRFNLGVALVAAERPDAAIGALEECLELSPGFPPALKGLGQAWEQKGERAQAVQHFKAYLEAMPDAPDAAEVREKIAELERQIGQPPGAARAPAAGSSS